MKVLLVHLSDIHVESGDDHVLDKASKIANAVRNLEHDLAACFLVVSGDSAFSGAEEQYWAVLGLLQELKESLISYLRTDAEVRFIVVPGNHDCDFGVANEVRDTLIDAVEREPDAVPKESVVRECTAVQDTFFEYKGQLDEDQEGQGDRLYYEYRFDLSGRKVLFRCYNTAWLSRLHERQGQLFYPVDAAAGKASGFDLAVTVFHHPYNWLQQENARARSGSMPRGYQMSSSPGTSTSRPAAPTLARRVRRTSI